MGVLFSKDIPKKKERPKPFTLVLEKYKDFVVINSIKVDEQDDCVLHIEFDHDIDSAPEGEVAEEVGRVVALRIKEGLKIMDDKDYSPDLQKE